MLGKIFARRPLWQQLVLLALAAALPLVLSSYLMFNRMVANERETIRQSLLLNSKTLAALVDNEIAIHTAIAATLSQSPSLHDGDLKTFWQEAKDALVFVPGSWLSVRSPNGDVLLNTMVPFGTVFLKTDASPEVARVFIDSSAKVGDLAVGTNSKQLRALVDVPVFRDGKPLYVVSISLVPQRFRALIAGKYTNGEVAAIVDRNRKFVARIPAHDERVGTLASEGWRAAMDQKPEGNVENRTVEGDWSLTGYASTQYGWSVGVAQLESAIQSPLRNILWSSFAMSAALAALSFLLAGLIARNVSKGMGDIAKAAREVGEGKQVAGFSAPFAEANTVADTLVDASAELHRRGRALEDLNSELEIKVEERTAELNAELRRREAAEATLRQVQKIETIGQLTGGIAHDFNNMLTVIMGNLDTVQRRLKTLDGAKVLLKPLDAAMQGSRNAAKLTHRLLAFARQQPLEPEVLSLNNLIVGMSELMSRTVGEQIKIETVLGAGLWTVFADGNQVENALANLIVNARDAMPDGGKLTIETENAYLDTAYADLFGDVKSGQYVLLSVTDAGTGIAKDKLERIFEPFFTTKGAGKGTGLGLAMVHGFVKQSGGHIRVYSEVGEGTSVKIYLPRLKVEKVLSAAPSGLAISAATHVPRAKKGEVILLVEDDQGVRDYAVSVLQDLGYRVVFAGDGDAGLTAFKNAERIDLLFTDVVLAGHLNGRQVADTILKLDPTVPVLFTTGYSRNAIFHQGRLDPNVNLLNKPYTQRELALKIRAVIDIK